MATRDTVLSAAAGLFAKQGFAATSLAQVGQRAGVSKAAVLYHFPTKEALLTELVRPLVTALETYVAGRAAASTATERRAILADLLVLGHQHLDALLAIEADRRSWSHMPVAEDLARTSRSVADLLSASAARPDGRASATATVAVLFRGLTRGLDLDPRPLASPHGAEAGVLLDICAATLER